ncbi:diguanylate cyclase [Aureimonas sp. AU20]|uniref:GGDEF domain-containing protein n=1 Tax=Aureimonas sp. AU20 TaxID=1349819 RepID=UPI00072118DC|nr:GGDEF domain-containing protein [Aureimonas sp. AU20]ALN72807.1 hypothetical protein M673_08765 [Aureimonas sp. AU20]
MNSPHTPALEAEFARLNHLRFSPAIEARFETDEQEQRLRSSRLTVLVAVAVYDAFLVADWQIMSDMVGWLALMRLGIFTPLALLVFWMLPRMSKSWQIDAMTIGCTVLAVLFPTTAMVFSHSPYVLIYQFGSMVTITYFTLVQRVRFRMAVIGLVASLTVQFWCVALRPEIDAASYQFVVSFYLSGAALLLMGSFVLERTERHGFLERLRSELLIEHIERTARTDMLTGLSNRHHLAAVGKTFADGHESQPIAALMIDIDHFKRFNDTQGHLAGDRCIRAVADLIRQELERAGESEADRSVAFRFGGEEFLILLPGSNERRAAVLGEAIRRRLEAARIPHPAMGVGAWVTASLGVAACQQGEFSLDALVGAADAALYHAKRDGRNCLAMTA